MDNATRSERSRTAAIQAALKIIARDGPGKLTFDAIARESGMSKGGLMHQFRTKQEVLKALLEHQTEHFERFSRDYEATLDTSVAEPMLMAQIATAREATDQPQSVALALVAAFVEDPTLLAARRDNNAGKLKQLKAQAEDPELAMLRWAAATGLMLSELFGLSPFSAKERNRLFDRLLDDGQWTPTAAKDRANGKANGKTNGKATVARARSKAATSIGRR
ncbi:TetR/AcrR family transcriptional regulator [Trinickia caryophylli]|uniref:Transcriptional regulator, TetR family n=1 Tax=Trinickia caryophylli TaxID=28094 RepID=A0A1X7FMB5_TRICW|nr:TetR/AcrR family transcriptional regulator [Trinickia caryophylli]PMS13831.1 TetR/AcrR family transcriptional regulator [Trinickia caryophylli]TRX14327.1 TetR/AcrR family transcriptional regulator [Trinickia caryophylli]WQE14159.1 TetR/AcrR family transcriptional regulator [Trinickia caryophylli]SMF54963.1 transcriptional regulator, TetR family [Trinickia caryophylli]GLU33343.1 TetR family transcriptional regulator [Trinickia caryophylli]